MTLDEAIKHAEEVAESHRKNLPYIVEGIKLGFDTKEDLLKCQKCIDEHEQIAEWLKELKTLREYITTELEICCAGTHDSFEAFDDKYYVLSKLNNMIAYNDRFPNKMENKE